MTLKFDTCLLYTIFSLIRVCFSIILTYSVHMYMNVVETIVPTIHSWVSKTGFTSHCMKELHKRKQLFGNSLFAKCASKLKSSACSMRDDLRLTTAMELSSSSSDSSSDSPTSYGAHISKNTSLCTLFQVKKNPRHTMISTNHYFSRKKILLLHVLRKRGLIPVY